MKKNLIARKLNYFMSLNQPLIAEFKNEAKNTRRILERIPMENAEWRPHTKSTTIGRLATHVAELPGWITMIANTEGMNFGNGNYNPTTASSQEELLAIFDKNVDDAVKSLEGMTEDKMKETWALSNGDRKIFEMPKAAVIRSFSMNHMLHHRAQLSVYLRLNDIQVPGMYGPSADEKF